MKLSISIVIPTYNGLELLKKFLPSIKRHANGYPIIVVDDASDDTTVKWLEKNHPEITLVVHTENQGFAAAVNTGFQQATTDLVLLLNNDVAINQQTISRLAHNFRKEKKLFAVGAKEVLPNRTERGKSIGCFSRGLLVHSAAPNLERGKTLWVFAASGMFSRKKWVELAGLDTLYYPAYWEDIDISYRAWKAGYTCLFDPRATVEHQAEATMNKELGGMKQIYSFKNQLLFFWKNVTDLQLIIQHIIWIPYHLVVTSIKTRGTFLLGFMYALLQLAGVFRQHKKYQDVLTDRQVIETVAS